MERKSTVFLSLLVGAAVGATIAYLITSGKSEELKKDIKEGADKIKDEIDKQIGLGKDFVEDLKHKADDVINKIHQS